MCKLSKPKTFTVGLVVRIAGRAAVIARRQRALSPHQAEIKARERLIKQLSAAQVEAVAL